MYRSDIHQALIRIELVPGGAIDGLLKIANSIQQRVELSCVDIAANNDAKLRTGSTRLQDAIRPLSQLLSELSPSAMVIELHQLSSRFDEVLDKYSDLGPFLHRGRQALSALSGAFDAAIQQNRRPAALVKIVHPVIELSLCYVHYGAVRELFDGYDSSASSADEVAVVEIDGTHSLKEFADYLTVMLILGEAARDYVSGEAASRAADILIDNIESGSPIRINLVGDGKVIQLMASMFRDILRVPYQLVTRHGRLLQTMETFARAKELGIESPELKAHLSSAMVRAAELYARSVEGSDTRVSIDGKAVDEIDSNDLQGSRLISPRDKRSVTLLAGPSDEDPSSS